MPAPSASVPRLNQHLVLYPEPGHRMTLNFALFTKPNCLSPRNLELGMFREDGSEETGEEEERRESARAAMAEGGLDEAFSLLKEI